MGPVTRRGVRLVRPPRTGRVRGLPTLPGRLTQPCPARAQLELRAVPTMTSGHDHRHQLLADPSKVTGPSQREPTTGTRHLPHRRTTPSDAPETTQCGREFETSGFPAAQDLHSPSQHLPSTGHWSNQAIELQYKSAGHGMIKSGRRGARTHNPWIHGRSSVLTAVVPSELRRRGPGSGPTRLLSAVALSGFGPFPVRQPRQESGLGLGCHAFSRGNPGQVTRFSDSPAALSATVSTSGASPTAELFATIRH